jgi:hypothetical protein
MPDNPVGICRYKGHGIRTSFPDRINNGSLSGLAEGGLVDRAHPGDVIVLLWSYGFHLFGSDPNYQYF